MTRREEGLEPAAHQGSLQQNPRVGGRGGAGGRRQQLVGWFLCSNDVGGML